MIGTGTASDHVGVTNCRCERRSGNRYSDDDLVCVWDKYARVGSVARRLCKSITCMFQCSSCLVVLSSDSVNDVLSTRLFYVSVVVDQLNVRER